MTQYNKTQLDIEKAAEREYIHRDYIAHALRWTHICRHVKRGQSVLDLGCAPDVPLCMMLYTNMLKPRIYMGVDLRTNFKKAPSDFHFPVLLMGGVDIAGEHLVEELDANPRTPETWDFITCLEVIEHMPKESGLHLLDNIQAMCGNGTTVFLSTPCFNGSAAANHIYEWRYEELYAALQQRFSIDAVHGTFASKRDIVPVMSAEERAVHAVLEAYYDADFISVLFAPLHPANSRNCIWRLRRR